MMMERWLPGLGLAVVLCLMAVAAVAQGQPAPGQFTGTPPMAARGPDGDGPPRPHSGWDRHRHDGGFRPMAREQMCKEGYAHEAGFLAYLGAKLELTGAQQPLWDTYHQAMLDGAGKLRQACLDNTSSPQSSPTALERRDSMEKSLTARLDFLHATRPPLEALYQSLSPEQRALLDQPHRHGPRPER
jgi:hypothetical protein